MRSFVLLTTFALVAAFLVAPAIGDEGSTLSTHPMKDAKPGEYMRFVTEHKGYKRYSVQTVLEVKDGKAWIEEWLTNEEGDKQMHIQWAGWARVPSTIKPLEYQKVVKDEMVKLEIDGKTLSCRHLVIDQPEDPPMDEPREHREVWFTNDAPGWGRVKLIQGETTKTAVEWGTMSDSDRDKAIQARNTREKQRRELEAKKKKD